MKKILGSLASLWIGLAGAQAGDWPMWRHDAARSAASPDGIGTNLTLQWTRRLPPVRQAWPLDGEQRLNFDASYEPVVMGKLLFLGSPNDGTVTAYETETGVERWKFFTQGPVRCAPACRSVAEGAGGGQGKVYAGSDDGYLYCLEAETGKLLWKYRGAPADRPEHWQIGNGHLVSFWPVRGGPVVADGTVYFAAGVWSLSGVFVQAVDAETGRARWTNSELDSVLTCVMGLRGSESGLSPQGYLVAIRDRLVVPNGRAMPAGLDLRTGRTIYYLQGQRGGDSRVAAHGEYGFVGRERVVNLYDFRELGSKWAYRGAQAPEGYIESRAWYDWFKMGFDLYESCMLPYKLIEGCDAYSAFADGVSYGLAKGTFYAYDLTHTQLTPYPAADHGAVFPKALKWEPPLLWQYKSAQAGQNGASVIKAGSRLYGAAGKTLIALENLESDRRIAWEKPVDGKISSLAAADGKLFAVTAEGSLLCFGQSAATATPRTHDSPPVALSPGTDGWSEKAKAIVEASGVKSGYCLVLGLAEGRLVEELLKQTDLLVIAVDDQAERVAPLYRRLAAAGLLGTRAQLFTGRPFEFRFPPYLASLIVSENPGAAGFSTRVPAAGLFNTLRPYGGTLCLELPSDVRPGFTGWAKQAGATNATAKQTGPWSLLVREGALPGSAPWSHEAADAGRTLCSQDDLVRAPLGLLWYGDMTGLRLWKSGTRPTIGGGRVFSVMPHAKYVDLYAYDAYTGRALWHKDPKSVTRGHARLAIGSDAVYFAMDGECRVIDPATGTTRQTFAFNQSGMLFVKDLRVEGDIILVACSTAADQEKDLDYWSLVPDESSILVCLDRPTGAELWRREAQARFNSHAIAVGGGRVFVTDSLPPSPSKKWDPRLNGLKECTSTLLSLDARSGKQVWADSIVYEYIKRGHDDWLAYSAETGTLIGGRQGRAYAWEGKTGRRLWENKTTNLSRGAIVRGKTVIGFFSQYAGTPWGETVYDLTTGQPDGKTNILQGFGCSSPLGGRHLLTLRAIRHGACYLDLAEGRMYRLCNIRPGCVNNLLPADGLLNAPSMGVGCICSVSLLTSFAMVHMPEIAEWSGQAPLPMTPPPAIPRPANPTLSPQAAP
jgi:outer membrane protein assembly factor BamB